MVLSACVGSGVARLRLAAADVPAGRAGPEPIVGAALLAAVAARRRDRLWRVLAQGRFHAG